MVWQTVHDARRDSNKFRESSRAAIVAARNSENLPVVAQIHFTANAVAAGATVDCRIEGNSVPFGKLGHTWSQRSDSAGSLMPHNNGRNAPARRTVIAVNVTSADATSCHPHQYLARPRLWLGQISNFQLFVFREQQSFHVRIRCQFAQQRDLPSEWLLPCPSSDCRHKPRQNGFVREDQRAPAKAVSVRQGDSSESRTPSPTGPWTNHGPAPARCFPICRGSSAGRFLVRLLLWLMHLPWRPEGRAVFPHHPPSSRYD